MPSPQRFRAPGANGEVLAVPRFEAIARLVVENQRRLDRGDVTIGGLPLRELRARARNEVLELASSSSSATANHASPVLVAGHQPELFHPGVWVKNFALQGLARRFGGIPLHLIVDNDTLKSTSLRVPVFNSDDPNAVHTLAVSFDTFDGELPYESRPVHDESLFRSLPERAAPVWRNWGYTPLLATCWPASRGTLAERFTAMRRCREQAWGCDNRELTVSQLSETEAFARFASHILTDLPRFRDVYNAAIRAYRTANGIRSVNHPAPELAVSEAPFWVRTSGNRRERATATSNPRNLRPRALTLTLFARVCLGDFFIHGIGGGKYDEVTDTIIRDYFGLEPPAYQVLSATLHLPLPGFAATDHDVKRAARLVRDLQWNPERYADPALRDDPRWLRLITDRAGLTTNGPFAPTREGRRDWFDELRFVVERLRPYALEQTRAAEAELNRVRAEARANAILRRRDYSWVLYPEAVLRPFLQQFLSAAPDRAWSEVRVDGDVSSATTVCPQPRPMN